MSKILSRSWLHVAATLVAGFFAGGITLDTTHSRGWAFLAAMAIAIVLGAGKELYDVIRGKDWKCWSWHDIVCDLCGGLVAALFMLVLE